MSNNQQKGGFPVALGIVVGILLMAGGTWFAVNVHPAFQETLAKQGIPLDLGRTIATIGVFLILFPAINSFFLTRAAGRTNLDALTRWKSRNGDRGIARPARGVECKDFD